MPFDDWIAVRSQRACNGCGWVDAIGYGYYWYIGLRAGVRANVSGLRVRETGMGKWSTYRSAKILDENVPREPK